MKSLVKIIEYYQEQKKDDFLDRFMKFVGYVLGNSCVNKLVAHLFSHSENVSIITADTSDINVFEEPFRQANFCKGKKWGLHYQFLLFLPMLRFLVTIKQTHLGKTILDILESDSMSSYFRKATVSVQTELFYFWGRLSLSNADEKKAFECFKKATCLCDPAHIHNRRHIGRYMIITGLGEGFLPSFELLKKLHLETELGPLVRAIHNGDIPAFDSWMFKNQAQLCIAGVFHLVCPLRVCVQASGLKIVWDMVKDAPRDNFKQVSDLAKAMSALWKTEITTDHMTLIIITLIRCKLIRVNLIIERKEPVVTFPSERPVFLGMKKISNK
ncbi:Csn12 family like protein [Aduncisulcus paluster]|uniref:Csn12 family like protein n=1 Tax=Aduncisulcus paluster TaxID=2918883 RepID=A0ABQ5KYD9_9EUKA|nr:Csn12 family like protein [Aduncisulcus paluster]